MSDNLAVIGAPMTKTNGYLSGTAYVFRRDADGNWNEISIIHPSDADELFMFGKSVSISGTRIIVGAPYKDNQIGGAYIYESYLE